MVKNTVTLKYRNTVLNRSTLAFINVVFVCHVCVIHEVVGSAITMACMNAHEFVHSVINSIFTVYLPIVFCHNHQDGLSILHTYGCTYMEVCIITTMILCKYSTY